MHHSHRSQSFPLILKLTNFAEQHLMQDGAPSTKTGSHIRFLFQGWKKISTRTSRKTLRRKDPSFFSNFCLVFPYLSAIIITHTHLCSVELCLIKKSEKSSIHICIIWFTATLVHLVMSLGQQWRKVTHYHLSPLLVNRDGTY